MLNQAPPGGVPPDVNRQLPQGLSIPGLQQQSAGQPSPFGQVPGTLNPMSGVNSPTPPAPPSGMLGMQPPGMQPPGMPSAPPTFGMPGGTPNPTPNMMGGGMPPPGGQGDVQSYVNALTKPAGM